MPDSFTSCVQDWVCGNLLWQLLWWISVPVIAFGFVPLIWNVVWTLRFLFKKHRPTHGHQGNHRADRFIQIWFSHPVYGIPYREGNDYISSITGAKAINIHQDYIDQELVARGLVAIKPTEKYGKSAMPVKDVRSWRGWRNRLVLGLAICWLVVVTGEPFLYFRDLAKTKYVL